MSKLLKIVTVMAFFLCMACEISFEKNNKLMIKVLPELESAFLSFLKFKKLKYWINDDHYNVIYPMGTFFSEYPDKSIWYYFNVEFRRHMETGTTAVSENYQGEAPLVIADKKDGIYYCCNFKGHEIGFDIFYNGKETGIGRFLEENLIK